MTSGMRWAVWSAMATFAACTDAGGGSVDAEQLFSGQTGSPAATPVECESDAQCLEAAQELAEREDSALTVRSASCEEVRCQAIFVGDAGCGPLPKATRYDCTLSDDGIREAWREELSEGCTDGGGCPPPAEQSEISATIAAEYCESDEACEQPIEAWAVTADEAVTYRDVACVEGSCQAMFMFEAGCSPSPHGPWYDCDLPEETLRERWVEDTTLQPEGGGGGEPGDGGSE